VQYEFQRVGVRQVPDIVEQGGALDDPCLLLIHLKRRADPLGDGECAQGMLEARVVRSGIDEVREAELVYAMEALQFWDLEQGEGHAIKLDPTVN
jgi:hypothetical protein